MSSNTIASHDLAGALAETRERTLALVADLGDDDLSRVLTPLLSPLIWDLGHIANFEQRWLLGGGDGRLDALYNPFKQPRRVRGELAVPRGDECFDYMLRVRERVLDGIDRLDPISVELVIQHEQQHNETMLQLLRMLDGFKPPAAACVEAPALGIVRGEVPSRWIGYADGEYRVGATSADDEFVYDNEIGGHGVSLAAFEIALRPVLNGEYREWIDGGGYADTRHWSPEGRAWLAEERARGPLHWRREGGEVFECGFGEPRPLDDRAPVCHVCWFEADAYARAHGARLPTEPEWEVAASRDPGDAPTSPPRRYSWGDDPWRPEFANLDQLAWGAEPAGARDGGSSETVRGPIDMLGQVWEWTASEFTAYPGFEPFRYAEYSAPFFDGGYRVLRGGSWATRARTVDNRFRNWDHPRRRQIFSGFRLARDT